MFKKEMELVKEVSRDLGLKEFDIKFITAASDDTTGEKTLGVTRYDGEGRCTVEIMPYKYPRLFKRKVTRFVICHELRHVWQFQNNYDFSSNLMPYKYKREEIDANDYALKFLKTDYIRDYILAGLGVFGALGLAYVKTMKNNK